MPYVPLLRADQIHYLPNPPSRNEAVEELLDRLFDADILPDRWQHPRFFRRADIRDGLYLRDRRVFPECITPGECSGGDQEDRLGRKFWAPDARSAVICVLGRVGSGKSTLVDYYLRCHCYEEGQEADVERFDKKLIIHFDAMAIQDNTDFYHDFFLKAQASIRYQGTLRGCDVDSLVRRRPTQPNNIREWVWAALEELTRSASRREAGSFEHIVLVIDNLDQTTQAVQRRAVTEVEQWLTTPTIRIWRVILPLWPSTYLSLRNSGFNLLKNAEIFRAGEFIPEQIIDDRHRALSQRLRDRGPAVGPEAPRFFEQITQGAKARILPVIEGLASGDQRRALALWGGLLRSTGAYGIWKQSQVAPDSGRQHVYEYLDALITGAYVALNHEDSRRIANLFALGQARSRPRDLLIGPHALHLLSQGHAAQSVLVQHLGDLGYDEPAALHVARQLRDFNVLHEIPKAGGVVDYEIHQDVVATYMGGPDRTGLLFEPAYIDNAAMVTPVDPATLARMKVTRGDRAADFQTRVETTLAFLLFLRDCEDSFRDPDVLRRGSDRDAFLESMEALGLPCLWGAIGRQYAHRLHGLRKAEVLKGVDDAWWDKILDDPFWAEAQEVPEALDPAPV